MKPGPELDPLLRRLTECPPDFFLPPRIGRDGEIHVHAVLADVTVRWRRPLPEAAVLAFAVDDRSLQNWYRLVLIAAWLAWDDWFVTAGCNPGDLIRWLETDVRELAKLSRAENFVTDPDRREELVRMLLAAVGYHPANETFEQASDRLDTVNTLERSEVVKKLKAQRERARELREEMERKQAQEAAARYTRE